MQKWDQMNQLRDEVWRTYVNNKLIEAEAKKLGLTVSKEEIKSIINEGTHPLLAQTPFRNPQTGAFDKDMLMKFLADYAKMNKSQMPAQYAEYYDSMCTSCGRSSRKRSYRLACRKSIVHLLQNHCFPIL